MTGRKSGLWSSRVVIWTGVVVVSGGWFVGGAARPATALSVAVERVSVSTSNHEGNADSEAPAVSPDGRYVVFDSLASNLVSGDTNGQGDVFLRDRDNGTTELISVDSAGNQGNGGSFGGSISADGRYVEFHSFASNLVSGDTNGAQDVFLRDRLAGTTVRVSVASDGSQANDLSSGVEGRVLSDDGRYVVFGSDATNLVAGDTNATGDIFRRDVVSGTTVRVDVGPGGVQADEASGWPTISGDGRYVAFASWASNLVANDTFAFHVFVHDMVTGANEKEDVSSTGVQGNRDASFPSISEDGQHVSFVSTATNLVAHDANTYGEDVFVHDRATGVTEMVDFDPNDVQLLSVGGPPSMSADGRFVSYWGSSTGQSHPQSYVRDRLLHSTVMSSVNAAGQPGNDSTLDISSLSGNGRYVAVYSRASNLVTNDTNHANDVFVVDVTTLGDGADVSPPTITYTTPPDGAIYALGQTVLAAFSCVDKSGVASCTGSVPSGSPIDTSTAGSYVFTVTGVDNLNNQATLTNGYTVVAPINVAASLPPGGGTLTTDTGNLGPTPAAPLQTAVSSPNGGEVAIAQDVVTQTPPTGFSFANLQVNISAPPADANTPLALTFSLDDSLLSAMGDDFSTVLVFRDGVQIGNCANQASATANPDPCVFQRTHVNAHAEIGVYSSHASTWNLGTKLPLTIATTELSSATVGVPYTQTLSTSYGTAPYAWSIISGSLPAGVTLNPATGTLAGVPTSAGIVNFTAQVTDGSAQIATAHLSITVAPTLDPAAAKVGVPYWHTVAAFSGVAPYHWTLAAGHFPSGLNLDGATGAISGKPAVEGKFVFTVQIVDSKSKSPTRTRTKMTIGVAPAAISVSPNAIPAAARNMIYTTTLTATGGTARYKFKLTSGALPPGIKLNPKGILAGKPTSTGTATFTVTVTDKFKYTQTRTYTLTVA